MNHVAWMGAAMERNGTQHIAGEGDGDILAKLQHNYPQHNYPQLNTFKSCRKEKAAKIWLLKYLWKTALPIHSAMRPVKFALQGWSWSCLEPAQGSCASCSHPQHTPLYRSNTQTYSGASIQWQTACGWTDTTMKDCRKPRVMVFHIGYLLPPPTALFWDQFSHLIIDIPEIVILSLNISVLLALFFFCSLCKADFWSREGSQEPALHSPVTLFWHPTW